MNSKLSVILFIVCLILFGGNHFLIDWKDFERKRAEESLIALIEQQRADLELWSNRIKGDSEFRKRTLCKGILVEWSDDRPFEFQPLKDSISAIENEHGLFLLQSMEVGGCQFISEYPLFNSYSITNQYLRNGKGTRLHSSITSISMNTGMFQLDELIYFDVESSPSKIIDAIISLIIICILLAEYYKLAAQGVKQFLIGTMVVILFRTISLVTNAFEFLIRYDLFDPLFYTSSFANPTLGDLLINCTLVLLVTLMIIRHMESFKGKLVWLFLGAICTSLALLIFHVPWSILSNSQIVLDVGNSIQFNFLRIVSFFCLILVGISFFAYLFFLQQHLSRTRKIFHVVAFSLVVAIALFPIKYLLSAPIVFACIVLLISLKVNWGSSLKDFNYTNLLYILIMAVGVAALYASVTYKRSERSELEAKNKFANYLLLKQDVLGEYYLYQSLNTITQDTIIYEIASERGKAELEGKILQEFNSPYFKKYDLEIVFQDYQSLDLNSRYAEEYGLLVAENETDYENIYFIDEGTNFKYICKASFDGFVSLVILQIKKRVPSNVYPALLTDSKYISFPDNFDYAVFAGDDILFHRTKFGQGEWPNSEDFDNEELYDEGIERNDRHYFGVKTSDGRTILIISKKYSKKALLANFCFFFLLLLSGFSFYSSINSIHANGLVLNFTSKIQLYLSLAFIVPLLTTGFALLTSLNTSYREEIDRSYLKQALYISEILSDEMTNEIGEDTQSALLSKIGNYIQSDISFYNESGYLIATSQPDIFSLGLQSNLVNPVVFEELVMKENQSMIAEESIGSLDYKVCYALVNNSENQVAGFIAMPFFDSRNHLRRQQIEIFENLITIFGLIFILAIVLGNFVLNNLLYPLRMVAGKIRQVTLQDVNKPILYESSDEIGSLVRDYNHMLIKLEESKIALARSQKETAWKEIARQVAHEIKNPLTPMQLKIQQMLRRYEKGSKDHDTLTSLLTQVDTLSQIAQSFSAFAEMPVPDNEIFVWNDLIKRIAMLYQSDDVAIELQLEDNIRIDADRDIFRRILNNIVLNAIQSVQNGQAEIRISLEHKSGKAVLSVSDNGRGVPDELKDKIFLNYFSTKSKGSGIGLALAKKGIENAGGNIWFESNQDQGTTFFISMPLVDS